MNHISGISVDSSPEQSVKLADLRDSVAAALDASPSHVIVERWKSSPGARSLRSWGISLGRRFFAKTLVQDPYPVMPRAAIPWCDPAAAIFRVPGVQIETEWATTRELRRLAGTDNVPAPLGMSLETRTIVWRDTGGLRVDDMVKRPRLLDSGSPGLSSALHHAGAWLRKIHDASPQACENLNPLDVLAAFRRRIESDGQLSSRHAQSALRALEAAAREAGPSLAVPSVLSHGDFMLANVRWNKDAQRLYIVDFENFGPSQLCQDLISLIFDLRSHLLNPLVPRRLVLALEKSFWTGYGPVAPAVKAFVGGVASARVFYYHLPQALEKRSQKGGLAGATASVYRTLVEPAMLARFRAAS